MDVASLLNNFKKRHIAVIGDVMVDAYLMGAVNRISPEAPVPIVQFNSKDERLGGAANVALNLVELGAKVSICSVIGDDEAGKTLTALFNVKSVNTTHLLVSKERKTTIKTRVLGNHQQLLRVDNEQTDDLNESQTDRLVVAAKKLIDEGCDALIFEDYNKGVLTDKAIREIIKYANQKGVITTVDPKEKNFFSYKNATLFKPNLRELELGINQKINPKDEKELRNAIDELYREMDVRYLFVTLSQHGVVIKGQDAFYHVPAHIRRIADVSGAGDTVISLATLCLVEQLHLRDVASIANLGGGLVCEEIGVVPIDIERLVSELNRSVNKPT